MPRSRGVEVEERASSLCRFTGGEAARRKQKYFKLEPTIGAGPGHDVREDHPVHFPESSRGGGGQLVMSMLHSISQSCADRVQNAHRFI